MPISFEDLLFRAESQYLKERGRQWKIYSDHKKIPQMIDIGVASHMNLVNDIFPKGFLSSISSTARKFFLSYPSHHQTDFGLEAEAATFVNNNCGTNLSKNNISIYSGVYGSYSMLGVLGIAQGYKKIFIAELVNQTYKSCFSALGYEVIEISCHVDGLVCIKDFIHKAEIYPGEVKYFYLNHSRGGAINQTYFEHMADVLEEFKITCLYDADVLVTSHDNITLPYLPLLVPKFFDHAIVLYNLTKEISLPGLRIGIGMAPENLTLQIRKYQSTILQMMPPPNRFFAQMAFKNVNINKAKEVLHHRICKICSVFKSLGWDVSRPCMGVNVFLDTPPSFSGKLHAADELFVFHLMKSAKLLVSPSSIRGSSISNAFRIVACQPESVYEQVLNRLVEHNINYNMQFPIGLEESLTDSLSI